VIVWHIMLGTTRFKVWCERDDDGDVEVGMVWASFKCSWVVWRNARGEG
jgi:hypothetical protein